MSIHKAKRKDGSIKWIVRVRIDGRGSSNVSKAFSRRKDAEQFEAEVLSRARTARENGLGVKNFEETTFKKEALFWLSQNSPDFSAGHLKRVRGILDELLPKLGYLAPNLINAEKLALLQSDLRRKGQAPATINRKTEVVTAVLNYAFRNKRIPFNPTLGFKKLRSSESDRVRCWEKWEAGKFLEYADQAYPEGSKRRWIYLVYKVALNTGMRAGEIWALRPKDLVQGGSLIHVGRQFDRVKKDFSHTKGRRARLVPCNGSEDVRRFGGIRLSSESFFLLKQPQAVLAS